VPREIQTAVQVANAALRFMEAPPISSFEEHSPSAQILRQYYNLVLRRCLSFYDWNFCGKQSELASLPASPLPQYGRAYHLPPDYVKLRWIRAGVDGRPGILDLWPYEIVAGDILVAESPPPIFLGYTYEAPVEYYPHFFLELLISALVEECSPAFGYNLTGQQRYNQRVYGPGGKLAEAIREERMQGNHRLRPIFGGVLGNCRNW
jgi:hypothetical protein